MSLAMSRAEREAFLAALHVGVISISESGRGPLTVPIWYAYALMVPSFMLLALAALHSAWSELRGIRQP